MDQIIRFFNDWWLFLALAGGAILAIVIFAAIVGRTGRKPVRRPAPKANAEPLGPVDPAEATNPAEPVAAVADELSIPAAEPATDVAPAVPDPVQSNPEAVPDPVQTKSEAVPVPIADPKPEAAPTPDPLPATAVVAAEEPAASAPEAPARPKEPKPVLGCYRVTYRAEDGKWLVTRDGSTKIQRTLETQTDAVNWATIKALTQNVELVVHKKDGTVKATTNPSVKKAS